MKNMEYGKGHVKIIPSPKESAPYDWEQETDEQLIEEVAPVTDILKAPSLERVSISHTVVLIQRQDKDAI